MYRLWWEFGCFDPDFIFFKLSHSILAVRLLMGGSKDPSPLQLCSRPSPRRLIFQPSVSPTFCVCVQH